MMRLAFQQRPVVIENITPRNAQMRSRRLARLPSHRNFQQIVHLRRQMLQQPFQRASAFFEPRAPVRIRLHRPIVARRGNQPRQRGRQPFRMLEIIPIDRNRAPMPRHQTAHEFVTEVRRDSGARDPRDIRIGKGIRDPRAAVPRTKIESRRPGASPPRSADTRAGTAPFHADESDRRIAKPRLLQRFEQRRVRFAAPGSNCPFMSANRSSVRTRISC